MQTFRRLVVTLALLMSAVPAFAQSPQISRVLSSTNCPGNGCVALGVQGLGSAAIQITGTFVATAQFESAIDGVTYSALTCVPSSGAVAVTSATATGLWTCPIAGFGQVRVRVSSYTSGNASVTIQGAQSGTGTVTPGDITGLAASTLLGRGSASAGAAQSIALGSNLTMSGTTLNASGGAAISATGTQLLYRVSDTEAGGVSGSSVSGDTLTLPGMLQSRDFLFTEQTTAGTYTATMAVPAGTVVMDVFVYPLATWAANGVHVTMGDGIAADGYFSGDNVKGWSVYTPSTAEGGTNYSTVRLAGSGIYGGSGAPGFGATYGINDVGNPANAAAPGIRYLTSDTITMTVTATIVSPPVVATGSLLIKVFYFSPITATTASFTP